MSDPVMAVPAASPSRRPVSVIAAVALVAVSIGWALVELPRVITGLSGPGGIDALGLGAAALVSLPTLFELAAVVLVWLRQGWARLILVPVALYYAVRTATAAPLLGIALALIVSSLVLLYLPTARAWFAGRSSRRR